MHNLFITIDGIDGCGKSTQLSKLHDYLFKKNKRTRILTTREPTYGRYGKNIRKMLAVNKNPYSDSDKLLNMYVKDREEHVNKVIKPFLKKQGDNIMIVLCDRYYYSTIVYQHAQGVDLQKVVNLNRKFPKPDLAIILDLHPETALHRISRERAVEKFEEIDFMKKLRKNFLELTSVLKDNIVYIDTSGNEHETFEKIRMRVDKMLRKRGFSSK